MKPRSETGRRTKLKVISYKMLLQYRQSSLPGLSLKSEFYRWIATDRWLAKTDKVGNYKKETQWANNAIRFRRNAFNPNISARLINLTFQTVTWRKCQKQDVKSRKDKILVGRFWLSLCFAQPNPPFVGGLQASEVTLSSISSSPLAPIHLPSWIVALRIQASNWHIVHNVIPHNISCIWYDQSKGQRC